MSEVADRLSGMHHPWRELRALPEWLLLWEPMEGVLGRVDWVRSTITLDPRQGQAERRCTIAHELEHVRRGPPSPDPASVARDELATTKAAARRMIPIERLGDALAWSCDPVEVAFELWVDLPTLRARLGHLHPAERHYLHTRTEHHEHR